MQPPVCVMNGKVQIQSFVKLLSLSVSGVGSRTREKMTINKSRRNSRRHTAYPYTFANSVINSICTRSNVVVCRSNECDFKIVEPRLSCAFNGEFSQKITQHTRSLVRISFFIYLLYARPLIKSQNAIKVNRSSPKQQAIEMMRTNHISHMLAAECL